MSDDGNSNPVNIPPPVVVSDNSGPTPVPANVHHHDDRSDPTPFFPTSKERDFFERPSRRPSFIENVADSREAQFTTQDISELERYFHGPRNMNRHSKWPLVMRIQGSVLPQMIIPLFIVGGWATLITCMSQYYHNLGINNILLTVLGFVVDGRKYWAALVQTSRNMARIIWVHIGEREGEDGKVDMLRKLSAMNLILAFAVALKHKLRFEPDVAYNDLAGLVGHLDTFALYAHDSNSMHPPSKTPWKSTGEYLRLPFARSNPRKLIKRSKKPLGHLPVEILMHISAYIDCCVRNGTLSYAQYQGQAMTMVSSLNEILTGTERVLDTPLPAAYSIAIAQISWIYVMLLPFQLYKFLGWTTIPASIVAAYIIIGLFTIGSEIENPFGQDVNDLPLTSYCRQIAKELDIITASPPPNVDHFMTRPENLVLFPLSQEGYPAWEERSKEDIRAALRAKIVANSGHNPAVDDSNTSTMGMSFSIRSTTESV
ncbi:hypothetical protein N7462_007616 [Penicillium macrosclerotiorum]|uniref:uncharacterized protein n=1 Tax=Penicillium macrosclerotiorum TaxID=303699 RepID=UPI002549A91A|nr:uncharacterized protein N7462_007616 [Penicillium macrosclerotiorum]KAJ5679372.1 hypothetical protein N7462_007616 [Penicillium macrosclerotiorum]